jgi:hypothetical protein
MYRLVEVQSFVVVISATNVDKSFSLAIRDRIRNRIENPSLNITLVHHITRHT